MIRNPATRPKAESLAHLHAAMTELLQRCRPTSVAIEGIFYCRNARTAMVLGEARDVVLLACAQAGVPVFEYSPREVKRAATGRGQAEKSQVAKMVAAILGLSSPPPADAADALAIALCHAQAATARALGLGRHLGGAGGRG